jgi:queuine tRNA-ribosyltransferase
MSFSFEVERVDKTSLAKAGIITTPHGKILTPLFSPVATRASVRTISPAELKDTNTQVVLGNTYHLYLKPGIKVIKKFGRFADFMGWTGPTITDSGGYQVSFLWTSAKDEKEKSGKVIKITDEGAFFRSYVDGSVQLITPEKSMEIQKILGADIIMALDQPLGNNFSAQKIKEAFERTLKWEERSFLAWQKLNKKGNFQALYGIVQGGLNKRLRKASLDFVLRTGFPGIAIGGESIGSDPKITAETLDTICEFFPKEKPIHALGLGGGPQGIFEAVKRGVDTFDNTGITRMARAGILFISPEDGGKVSNKFRVDIKKTKFKDDKKPISKVCACYACANFSKAYIHHLITSKELLGIRLTSIHNIFFINSLMEKIRDSIKKDKFEDLYNYWLKV